MPQDHAQGQDRHRDHHGHGHAGHDHASHDHTGRGHAHHGHHHHAAPGEEGFALGTALNLGFVLVEAAAGLAAGSMALLADAAHNLSDVLGLLLAWGAARLAQRAPAGRRTYGFRRGTILAALGNAVLLLVAVGAIGAEAVRRLWDPAPVAAGWMLWVAAAGILVNGGSALLFARGREADLNRRGAYLHLLADAGVSAGVVVGALVIGWTGWAWVDPLLGLAIAGVILAGTWGLLRESMDLAMDVVPPGIEPAAVEALLRAAPGVTEVHDLHIWALSTTETALTAHLVRPGCGPDDGFLAALETALRQRFGIAHATLQVETGDPSYPCRLAPAGTL
ncbi:cation diffusion facilitator family transporter [Siccirubricoccus sp. KC 17139]|uniref:Cation diffusion facilitator family transporter n=1 Tax=Siccirubricoccus soli TaxID=2899147 RepID=A0ABT1D0D7_9PROT|nr:cation diffusion facilitator family transporter [Siccirubricoccus soli]MCO6415381.1 cation diffusion facilitator family transporter [Siccirubricoccus soli]MCP2681513.1 cation diffusion facilitator family transporter [Siccirubricoccus soli]